MPSVTLLRGAVAAGEGVVRLAPNFAADGERWLASISEPHLSCVAIGARRIPLRDAFAHLRDWYLGPQTPDWNVLARWHKGDLTLQPLDDVEFGPVSDHWTLAPGETNRLHHKGPVVLLCLRGHGQASKVAMEAPFALHDGQLTPDEIFVTGEAARRGIEVRNTSDKAPLELLRIFSEDPAT
ncbi:hypothetical protein [uncultured Paludibaculum sp.]|uniref:hypothetical protein n=1 Tax=uncultured Paludibaculum sp. TaxID=1765020 RepID=UPI002AAC09C3|nr:hypothetical protein [uncultured Paludibaculum sp.]